MEKMFEMAVRGKFRFNFKGVIGIEDLWDLGLRELDSIFKELNSKVKEAKEESLLNIKTKNDTELEAKIEIVKYIVRVKLEEADKANKAKETKAQKQKILEVLANKENTDLQNKSTEDLKKMLEELGE